MDHLADPTLNVEMLAANVGMSPRTYAPQIKGVD